MHGTCLYTLCYLHKSHDCPHFNIYISFGGSKYCILYNCTKYMSYITFYAIFHLFFCYIYVNCA
ncbi:CHS_3a_G0043190.mRNA.1.CDS.1 [Saccharomyces cerevisiae]|nr:CHS_3a_G0043190.mRNA.1.CDS.1 [Saccharomyces cerevisiae]CAI7434843.1 CHS_3a_G0043190.mRNA.1.CDS.1 [Saccharomyces cerevisiae]